MGVTLLAGSHIMFFIHTPISWSSSWLDHPVGQFIRNDHVLALGRLGLIRAHQHLLVHELDHANREQVHVELHLASIT
jgi:hypothetical protein